MENKQISTLEKNRAELQTAKFNWAYVQCLRMTIYECCQDRQEPGLTPGQHTSPLIATTRMLLYLNHKVKLFP